MCYTQSKTSLSSWHLSTNRRGHVTLFGYDSKLKSHCGYTARVVNIGVYAELNDGSFVELECNSMFGSSWIARLKEKKHSLFIKLGLLSPVLVSKSEQTVIEKE